MQITILNRSRIANSFKLCSYELLLLIPVWYFLNLDTNNIEKSYSRSKNNNNSMKAKKLDFKPSEKIIWPKMGFEHLARTKRYIIEKEKIIASQPSCNIILTRSKELCRNKEPWNHCTSFLLSNYDLLNPQKPLVESRI